MKGIHKEGFSWITKTIVALLGLSGVHYFIQFPIWVYGGLMALGLFWLVVLLQFFRVPARTPVIDPLRLISPADGKVVVVEPVVVDEWLGGVQMRQISVFMSPVNVHINWYPLPGKVEYFKYHPGQYLVAWHPKSSTLNERSAVGLTLEDGQKVLLRQIAGVLARKIVCYAKTGDEAIQGKQMGFIKFGSRVDLFIPMDWEVLVKPGDKVTGSITALAAVAKRN